MPAAGELLSGRTELLARVRGLLATPGARGVSLVGPAGIGKTHLARAIATSLSDEADLHWIGGSAATSEVPFGALAPFLPPDAGQFGLPAMILVRQGLLGDGRAGRLVLVVDDAQMLDEASAALVHQLAVSGEARLVVTQRSGVPAPDTITRLWRDHVLERIDLEPLDAVQIGELATTMLGDVVDEPSARSLCERSGGNPLFARELVLASSTAGEWRTTIAGWHWDVGETTSPRLHDLLADRLEHLTDDQRDALVHLAFGEPLGLGEMQAITSDAVIDELERLGLITADVDRRRLKVRFAHPAHADVVRRGVSPLRARLVRATLVNVLSATGARRREDEMRLATLALDAGVDLDPALLRRAARAALFANDEDLAARLAGEAFEREPCFDAGQILADTAYERGDTEGMVALWPAWEAFAVDEQERAIYGMHRAIGHYYRVGDASAVERDFAWLDEHVGPGPWRDEVIGLRAALMMASGQVASAAELAAPLIEGRGPDRVFIQAALAMSHSLRELNRGLDALQVVEQALDAYMVLGEQATLVTSPVLGMARSLTLVALGRLAEALDAVELSRDAALRTGDTDSEGMSELIRSEVLCIMGRLDDSLRAARAAEATFERINHPAMARWSIWQRGMLAALVGDVDALTRALDDAERFAGHPARLFEHALVISRAAAHRLGGQAAEAAAVLHAGAEMLEARGERRGAARCWYEVVRLGHHGAGEPLQRVGATAEGLLLPAMAAHAAAFDQLGTGPGDLGEPAALEAAAARLAGLGAIMWAVAAGGQAAAAWNAGGDPRAAARCAQQVAVWSEQCQQVAVPTLTEAIAPPPLTRREREVALMAAQGLPSRTIAERLFLSARTVENHLARAYDKLGVRSRAELAHVLAGA